jgi:uncharacterized peroxidase-related enzyme
MDYRQADLSDADRALCDYAVKLTLTPGAMTEQDVQTLRAHGFDDAQITIAAQVISYFNYINRIADGLGVDNESWMTKPSKSEWLQRKGRFAATP